MKLKSKLFTGAVALTMVASLMAVPASAQTTAELTAMINSLLAQIAQLQAQIAGQGGAQGSAVQYNLDLTLGSTGADVTALQQFLVSKGHLQMPAGVAYGYFGPLTQAALGAYQASVGISPAVGYFGPITRAHMNAMVGTGTGTGSTGTGSTGITTPGAEGVLSVSQNNSGVRSTVYEGESKVKILGFDVKAQLSDIAIQRVKVNLGTNSKIYTKGYETFYILDKSGNVLGQADSSEAVKEGSTYYVTITGFNHVVPAGTEVQMYLAADVMSSIDTTDRSTLGGITVTLPISGVRGVDGAGIDQYSPAAALTGRSVTFDAELAESTTLKVSLNSSSPKRTDLVATSGTDEDEMDDLVLLVFDVKAEKGDVKITDLVAHVSASSPTSNANASSSVSIWDGSTELDSVTPSAGYAAFTDIDYVVPKDTTKTLTLKADVRDATGTVSNFIGTASSTGFTAESDATADTTTVSGSATGYTIGIRKVGPEISLVSKNIVTSGVPQSQDATAGFSTSTLTANFSVKIKAVGGDLSLGDVTSSTPLISSSTGFSIYRNGADTGSTIGSISTSTSFTIGNPCSTSGQTAGCLLGEGNEVTVPMAFQIQGRNTGGSALTSGLYSVEISELKWNGNSITFMAGENDWRTSDVSFP